MHSDTMAADMGLPADDTGRADNHRIQFRSCRFRSGAHIRNLAGRRKYDKLLLNGTERPWGDGYFLTSGIALSERRWPLRRTTMVTGWPIFTPSNAKV